MKIKKMFWLFLWTLFVSTACQDDITRISEFIEQVMEVDKVPGLSIAIVKDGEPYFTSGFGVKDIYTEEPVDENTLFFIQSTSKAMTATLLAKAFSESSSYDLDSPVKPILGDDFYLSEYYRTVNVNSRDLLAHRVNIPMSDYQWQMAEIKEREELIRRSRFFEATTQFRNNFRYNNIQYAMAGALLGQLLNTTYEEAMKTELFDQLGMYNTTFIHLLTDELLKVTATPHNTDPATLTVEVVTMDAYSGSECTAPGGGVVSSAADLVKWLQFQTNNGEGPSGEVILDPIVLEQTRTPHFINSPLKLESYKPFAPVTFEEPTYGLGWSLGTYREYRMSLHGGSSYGFWSRAMVLPDMKMGAFICTNGPNGALATEAMTRIMFYTMDILLGEEPWVNATYQFGHGQVLQSDSNFELEEVYKIEQQLIDDIEINILNRNSLVDYEGMYGNFAMGNISVVYDSDTDQLTAYFGDIGTFNVTLRNDEDPLNHVVLARPQDPLWFLPPVRATFHMSEQTGQAHSVTVPIFLPENPPLFVRDLDIASAPDPPTDNCPV